MSAPVDVLAVLERLEDYYRRHEVLIGPVDDAYSVQHKDARLAVAELIEAGRDLQGAMDEHERHKFDIGPSKRFIAADARHRAALARVGGAK